MSKDYSYLRYQSLFSRRHRTARASSATVGETHAQTSLYSVVVIVLPGADKWVFHL